MTFLELTVTLALLTVASREVEGQLLSSNIKSNSRKDNRSNSTHSMTAIGLGRIGASIHKKEYLNTGSLEAKTQRAKPVDGGNRTPSRRRRTAMDNDSSPTGLSVESRGDQKDSQRKNKPHRKKRVYRKTAHKSKMKKRGHAKAKFRRNMRLRKNRARINRSRKRRKRRRRKHKCKSTTKSGDTTSTYKIPSCIVRNHLLKALRSYNNMGFFLFPMKETEAAYAKSLRGDKTTKTKASTAQTPPSTEKPSYARPDWFLPEKTAQRPSHSSPSSSPRPFSNYSSPSVSYVSSSSSTSLKSPTRPLKLSTKVAEDSRKESSATQRPSLRSPHTKPIRKLKTDHISKNHNSSNSFAADMKPWQERSTSKKRLGKATKNKNAIREKTTAMKIEGTTQALSLRANNDKMSLNADCKTDSPKLVRQGQPSTTSALMTKTTSPTARNAPETESNSPPKDNLCKKPSSKRSSRKRHNAAKKAHVSRLNPDKNKTYSNSQKNNVTMPVKTAAATADGQYSNFNFPSSTQLTAVTDRSGSDITATVRPAMDGTTTVRPAMERTRTVRPAMDGTTTVRPAMERTSTVRPSMDRTSTVRPSMDRTTTVRPAMYRTTTVRLTMDGSTTVRPAMDMTTTVRPAMDMTTTVRPAMDRTTTVRPAMDRTMTVRPAMDMTTTVRPAMDRTTTVRPAMDRTTTVRPAMDRTTTVRPAMDRTTTVRPAMDRTTIVRPAMDSITPVRPAMDWTTTVRPAMDRTTTVQPTGGHTSHASVKFQAKLSRTANLTLLFKRCASKKGEIVMDGYISAYIELCKTFEHFGVVMQLASQDILQKLKRLRSLQQEDPAHYETFEGMFQYEYAKNIADIKTPVEKSGVRRNQLIHRGLKLLLEILREISKGYKSKNSLKSRVQAHYEKILSPYHSFWVRSAVRIAFMTFPSYDTTMVIFQLPINSHGRHRLKELTEAVDYVYNKIEALYTKYDKTKKS